MSKLFKEASDLAEADRAALAGLLLESIEPFPAPEIDAAWAQEIERRLHQIEAGEVKTVPWDEVKQRLWARFGGAQD
ncbi:MAG TPA: addiction module protein [Rudaea sp.]|nr:addiction module protein [Rudaea sp.]